MPTYEYGCSQCGGFTAIRPMRERNDPQSCPGCGSLAARELLTAPAFAGLPAASRAAYATNERAANEPKLSSKHGMSCACCTGRKSGATERPGGMKAFAAKRPWMISH
jgi:putative FmdB family regulatory protein